MSRSRRRAVAASLIATALALSACGDEPERATPPTGGDTTVPGTVQPADAAPVAVPERLRSTASPDLAGRTVTDFGFDLFTAAAATKSPGENLVLSPLSVAIALGMIEPGTSGDAVDELHALLGIDDPAAWQASMSALERSLEARAADDADVEPGTEVVEGSTTGELLVRVANAAFLQPGYPFLPAYLDAIGTTYGPVLEELDFASDQAAAAERINAFIADATDDHITDLVQPDAISPDTVLALVNALLLQASWQQEFDAAQTTTEPFTLLDGTTIDIPMMNDGSDRSGRGDGWVGASKRLAGNLRFEVVLPDAGRFDDVAARYATVVDELAAATNPGGLLGVPRFETRVNTPLTDVLQAMGLTAPFVEGSLLGIADDSFTKIDKVLHEAWLSVDESGIEAAAATVLLAVAASAPADLPVDVVLDRPFLFRILDDTTGATLFAGRIMNPTD